MYTSACSLKVVVHQFLTGMVPKDELCLKVYFVFVPLIKNLTEQKTETKIVLCFRLLHEDIAVMFNVL